METLLPLVGVGSLAMFIVLVIVSAIGALLRKGWAKKSILLSLVAIFVLIMCLIVDKAMNQEVAETETKSSPEEEVKVDFNEFTYEIESFTYNKDTNAIDINLATNIPDGVNVEVDFTKMIKSEEGIEDINDPIVKKLTWDREGKVVENGKLVLHYDGSDVNSTLINGKYGVWLSFEVSSQTNSKLYEELGSFENVHDRFTANSISETGVDGGYSVILGQVFLEITDSISYLDLKQKEKQDLQQRKLGAKDIRFAELDKNPDKYYGEYAKYQGQVLQIMEDSTSTVIRLAVTKDDYGYNYEDVVYVTYIGTTPYVEDDIITVYGTIKGSYTYESQAGHNITLPRLDAEIVE